MTAVTMSFANNFWGKDDAGVEPLLQRMHNAKQTCDELKVFYNARAALEDDYARKLLSLSRKPLGSQESGTLRASLDVLRGEVEQMGKSHHNVAGSMKTELEEPLAAFAGAMKERRKIIQSGVEKLHKVKVQQTNAVNKSRDKYEQECLKIKGYLAQGHMVMGHEERKNKAKLEKTQINLATSNTEYEAAVKVLEETTGRWNRDWKAAADKFQDLEEERLDFMKSSLWSFANIASTVCVSDDASCEKVRLSLENCEVEKDIMSFIKERGTGQEIPDPPKYINFCRGDINDTQSEASEDENYSVAQFQRTINPAFRSSSPQPSTYESHHDPNSALARDLGHREPDKGSNRDITITQKDMVDRTRQAQQDMNRSQYEKSQQAPLPSVPHEPYPMDGMTILCRPSSDRSSAYSGARPSSRDSQSDYSNPTSFSSQEPPSGQQSPIKPDTAISPYGDKTIPKKKSGFFQGHSPFRRRSKHEKDSPVSTTPSSRNTWSGRDTANPQTTPSRRQPLGNNPHGLMLTDRGSASPEPVDPRASFQLNIGNNVFDVATPDRRGKQQQAQEELDPIAQALAELKGVTKQSSVRMSADHYHGIATPAPGATGPTQTAPSPLGNGALMAGMRGTPPPSYDQPIQRLGAPQPAHTSKAMQKTTQKYVNKTRDVFSSQGRPESQSGYASQTRSATRPESQSGYASQTRAITRPESQSSYASQMRSTTRPESQISYASQTRSANRNSDIPRATSPMPQIGYTSQTRSVNRNSDIPRATSPMPQIGYASQTRSANRNSDIQRAASPLPQRSVSPHPATQVDLQSYRSASPNPYGGQQRSRQQPAATSPNVSPSYYRQSSPGDIVRAASPAPFRESTGRPSSSGSYMNGGDMSLQLAQPDDGYGSQRNRGGGSRPNTGNAARPMSLYNGGQVVAQKQDQSRQRGMSVADGRQFSKDGRPILYFARAMYVYHAAIPEELSFTKGDILAVLRLQDDGWWEAEHVGKNGRPGLIPSNYVQQC